MTVSGRQDVGGKRHASITRDIEAGLTDIGDRWLCAGTHMIQIRIRSLLVGSGCPEDTFDWPFGCFHGLLNHLQSHRASA